MPEFNPWNADRRPLLEDERPYSDAKRPGVQIPPIRFREPDPLEDDEITSRYMEYRRKFLPKKGPGKNGSGALQIPAPDVPAPLFGTRQGPPTAAAVFAPQAVPASAFDRLPPEARAGIVAGAAEKAGGPALYPGRDGKARRLSENSLSSVAMLEVMYVPAPGDPKPYGFDDWIGFHLKYDDAYQRMVTVCAFLRRGMEPPPQGEELKEDWQEVLLQEDTADPPAEAATAAGSPDMPPPPSNSDTPTQTPSSTPVPPSEASPNPSEPSASESESCQNSSEHSPELTAALNAARERLAVT